MAAIQAIVLGALGCALAPVLYGEPEVVLAGRLFLLLVPISLATDYLGQLARAKLRVGAFNGARIIQAGCQAVFVLILYATRNVSLLAVLEAVLLSYTLGAAVLVGYAAANGWLRGRLDLRLLRRTLAYAVRLHPGAEARELNLYLDQLMMSLVLPLASLGLYASAVSAATVLRVGSSAFLLMSQAEVQAVSATERRAVIARLARVNVGLLLPAALALVVALPFLLPAVYGGAFAPAVTAAQILCLAGVIEGLGVAMGGVLVGTGRASVATFWQLTGLGVSAIALLIWLPAGQIQAAAWISLLSYAVSATGMVAAVARAESIPLVDLLVPRPTDISSLVRGLRHQAQRT
jgi:O-antigen/teichoic acid export membrane protein